MGTQEEATPRELRSVKIDEQMNAQVPLDATFKDQDGKTVRLGDVVDGKRPVLLLLRLLPLSGPLQPSFSTRPRPR